MKPEIGVSNLAFFTRPVLDIIDILGRKGFEHFEIIYEGQHSEMDIQKIKERLAIYDMGISLHAPFADLNIASLNLEIRKISLKQLKNSIDAASRLGAEVVTVHPGRYSPYSLWFKEEARKTNLKSLKELSKYAINRNITISLENTPRYFGALICEMEEIKDILRNFEPEELSFTLDVGHAYTCGDVTKLVEILGNRIKEIHLHDNRGDGDEHLGIGEGVINFQEIFKSLEGNDSPLIIEVHEEKDVFNSFKRLLKLL